LLTNDSVNTIQRDFQLQLGVFGAMTTPGQRIGNEKRPSSRMGPAGTREMRGSHGVTIHQE
jgi:hypothetical protein